MTDEAKALVERLRRFSSRPMEHDAPVMNRIAMDEAADLIETQARENERLRERLRTIAKGVENGQVLFAERQGNRAKPIWFSVNVLQEHLAAIRGSARAALGDSHDQ